MMIRKSIKIAIILILCIVSGTGIAYGVGRATLSAYKAITASILATTFSYTYDTATPAGTDDPREADDRIREVKAAIQERLNVEHVFDLTGTEVSHANSGQHTAINTTSITNAGTLTNAGSVTNSSTTEMTGDVTVNTNKVTMAAATGNTAIAGTLDVAGVTTIGDASKLATAAAPTDPCDIANKAYVDAQVATKAEVIGTITKKDSGGSNDIAGNTSGGSTNNYTPNGDGVIFGYLTGVYDTYPMMKIYIKLNAGGSYTQVGEEEVRYQTDTTFCFPVKSGDTFYLTTNGGSGTWNIWWAPYGSGGCVKN
jgi:hypothetical protein